MAYRQLSSFSMHAFICTFTARLFWTARQLSVEHPTRPSVVDLVGSNIWPAPGSSCSWQLTVHGSHWTNDSVDPESNVTKFHMGGVPILIGIRYAKVLILGSLVTLMSSFISSDGLRCPRDSWAHACSLWNTGNCSAPSELTAWSVVSG
jgi:hypothetical protein